METVCKNKDMDKFEELLAELKGLKITQKSMEWENCLPDDIWEKCFKDNHMTLDSELDVEKHRWYETSVSVISIYGEYLGSDISLIYTQRNQAAKTVITLLNFLR